MKKKNSSPERSCVVCGGKEIKRDLLRWTPIGGKLFPDWTQKMEGRAVYTHFRRECVLRIYDMQKKLPSALHESESEFEFAVKRGEIVEFIKKEALKSLKYYLSLCRKSALLFKGQNLIIENAERGVLFQTLFFASDASKRGAAEVERKSGLKGKYLKLSKRELGEMFDGKPLAFIAFKASELSEKFSFYMNLLEDFIGKPGDIDAY